MGQDTGADAPIRGGSPPCPEHAQADVPAVGHWRQEASLTDSLSQAFRTGDQTILSRVTHSSSGKVYCTPHTIGEEKVNETQGGAGGITAMRETARLVGEGFKQWP